MYGICSSRCLLLDPMLQNNLKQPQGTFVVTEVVNIMWLSFKALSQVAVFFKIIPAITFIEYVDWINYLLALECEVMVESLIVQHTNGDECTLPSTNFTSISIKFPMLRIVLCNICRTKLPSSFLH